MTKKVLQMMRRANEQGVTYIGQFVGCKLIVTAEWQTRYRTVTKSGTFSVAANAGKLQRIRIDVDEYKKHYPDVNILKMMKKMRKGCKIMEVE